MRSGSLSVDIGGSRPAKACAPEGCGRVDAVLPVPSAAGSGFSADDTGVSFEVTAPPPCDFATLEFLSDAFGMMTKRYPVRSVPEVPGDPRPMLRSDLHIC